MGTIDLFILFEKGQYRNGLDCFSKAHIISQDAANSTLIETYHPIQANKLIVFQNSSMQNRRLLCQSCKDVLFMLLLLNHYLDLLVLFFKMASFFCLNFIVFPQHFVLRQQKIGVKFSLFDQALNSLFESSIGRWLECLKLLED